MPDQLGRVVDAWKGLNYSARGSVQRAAPTLADALNDAADRTDTGRCTFMSPIAPYGRCTLPAWHGKDGGPAVHECDPVSDRVASRITYADTGAPSCACDGPPHTLPCGLAPDAPCTEQVQPLPPVDNVAGCDVTNLGRRCLLAAGHDEWPGAVGHSFPPLVPAGGDRFA